jgi:hypothetical protein
MKSKKAFQFFLVEKMSVTQWSGASIFSGEKIMCNAVERSINFSE